MTHIACTLNKALAAATLFALLTACGGSNTPTAVSNGPGGSNEPPVIPPEPVIQGIATPSSVSVVTATNAN